MIQRPAEQRWPITAEERQRVVNTVLEIATTKGDERVQLAACRVAIAMMAQNQRDEHHPGGKDGDGDNKVLHALRQIQASREPSDS